VQYCRDYFFELDPLYLENDRIIEPDLNATMISIGIMAASVVITHILMAALSTYTKSEIVMR